MVPRSLTSAFTGRPGPAARRATRQLGLSAPPAFPRGWFAVGFSAKLRPGQLRTVTFMGTEAVLYRTASGQVCLAEAYCPHLGAHIGLGGAVRGELIQCPFHGLGFGADGQCVSSPDGRPPRTARLRMFDTREVDGVIVAYHDPGGQPAEWWIESRAPAGRWPAPTTRTWRFRGHPQEVSENSVDLAHLSELHRFTQVRVIEPVTIDGPRLDARYAIRRRLLFTWGVYSEFSVRVEGLGFSVVEMSIPWLGWEVHQLVLPTSVDETDVELRLCVSLRSAEGVHGWRRLLGVRLVTAVAQRAVASIVAAEINRDIPIWQHKRYLERPALCPGEGSIGRYRKWTRQFYSPVSQIPSSKSESTQLEGLAAKDTTAFQALAFLCPNRYDCAVWGITFADLRYRYRQFLIAVVGAGLVLAVALLMSGLVGGFTAETDWTVGGVGAQRWVLAANSHGSIAASEVFSQADVAAIARAKGVTRAAPLVIALQQVARIGGKTRNVEVFGVQVGNIGDPAVTAGRALSGSGQLVADAGAGAATGTRILVGAMSFRVVGQVNNRTMLAGIPILYVSLHDAQALALGGRPLVTAVVTDGIPATVPAGLIVLSNQTVEQSILADLSGAVSSINNSKILMWLVAAIIVAALLYVSALQRVRDFAVIKALGSSSAALFGSLALQAVVVTLLAAAFGMVACNFMSGLFKQPVAIPPSAFATLPVIAVVVGILASLVALRRVTRVDPAAAFGA